MCVHRDLADIARGLPSTSLLTSGSLPLVGRDTVDRRAQLDRCTCLAFVGRRLLCYS